MEQNHQRRGNVVMTTMRYADIFKDINKIKNERKHQVCNALSKQLCKIGYNISNLELDFDKYEDGGYITYDFTLQDGFSQNNSVLWKRDESIEKVVKEIIKQIDYIQKLREQYPEYARQNDYIQANRVFEKECTLFDMEYKEHVYLKANLCGYLKLPNIVEHGFGGGDYEIKRTPKRVSDFNKNIDTLCLFLADCISDLRKLKTSDLKLK